MTRSVLLILASVVLAVTGQLTLKFGMMDVGRIGAAEVATIGSTAVRVFTNWRVLVGLALYATSAMLYIVALSRVDISVAYPIVGLSYVVITLAAWLLLGEAIPPMRWVGVAVITLGVFLVARSA